MGRTEMDVGAQVAIVGAGFRASQRAFVLGSLDAKLRAYSGLTLPDLMYRAQ